MAGAKRYGTHAIHVSYDSASRASGQITEGKKVSTPKPFDEPNTNGGDGRPVRHHGHCCGTGRGRAEALADCRNPVGILPYSAGHAARPLRDKSGLDDHHSSVYTSRVSTVDDLRKSLEFLQGTLEVLILRSLHAAPNHAYGISQFLERQSDYEFAVDNGSLYPALQRLLQRRWITSQWKTSPNGRRAKYYRLTPLGRRQLLAEKSKWMRFVEAMSRVLAPER